MECGSGTIDLHKLLSLRELWGNIVVAIPMRRTRPAIPTGKLQVWIFLACVARHLVILCKQTTSRKSNAGVNWPPPQISSNICIYYIDLYHLLCSYPAFPAPSLSTFKQGSRSARSSCISCFKSSISRTASRHQEWQAQNATIRCGLGGLQPLQLLIILTWMNASYVFRNCSTSVKYTQQMWLDLVEELKDMQRTSKN